jgi:hypothetical protein
MGRLLTDKDTCSQMAMSFLVYRLLRNGLEAGDIFYRDRVRFRSFEDDLLDDQQWQQKEKLMTDTGLIILKQPISVVMPSCGIPSYSAGIFSNLLKV